MPGASGLPLYFRRSILLFAGVALMLSTLACNEVDSGHGAASRATGTSDRNVRAANAGFDWPEDPNHPILEIRVESPEMSGTIRIELMPELAPTTVAQVIELANEGFYDGTTFHRVIPGFMIQGGDPNSRDRDPKNDGKGAPGRPLKDEFGEAPFVRGVVGMGNKGRADSTSTQFFIMQADRDDLNGNYTAVGRVLEGMTLVDDLSKSAIDRTGRWGPKDRPIENIVMTTVQVLDQSASTKSTRELEAPTAARSRFDAGGATDLAETRSQNGSSPASISDGSQD